MRPSRTDPNLMRLFQQANQLPIAETTLITTGDPNVSTVSEAIIDLDARTQPLNDFLTDISNLPLPTITNRILYWNATTQTVEFLRIGTNLSISSGTLNASGGGGGSGNSYFPSGW
jgi:hypothetical protein